VYYVWETRVRRPTDVFIHDYPPSLAQQRVNFVAGRRIITKLPEMEIRYAADAQSTLTDDLVIRKRRCLVHSNRLADSLRRAGVDSIDYYPCRLVNQRTGAIDGWYQVANLLDVIFCLDFERSELDIDDEEPNEIWSIDRMKLREERLGDSLMFRLGERRKTVIVHDSVKAAIERDGLTGPVFLPADGYREYGGAQADNPVNLIGTHDLDPDGEAGFWLGDDDKDVE
jgi:uncharacterized protein DUF1629